MTPGFHARHSALRRSSGGYADDAEQVRDWRAELRAVFDDEGNPLGDDQYGAELAKRLPQLAGDVFGAFDAYIAELESAKTGLGGSATNYGAAEQASGG
ncbi:hypothetical protein [Nonomuraea zeae]|uniref:Uncharacterized protein n=1 Tax=Nonomuraea zeae TaxID=1642303 RepID=A0A5S4FCM5_9ACTN|nr:hypothetical protein [Nonomuraea zeae]TMR15041.1 hypothetical protein ETD85_56345 [Nonomuraea zeae]